MASVEKLPSGRYRGVYYDSAGKKQHTPTRDRKRDAQREANEAEVKASRVAAVASGTQSPSITWGEWYPVWWDARNIELSTRDTEVRAISRYVLPKWRDEQLNQISRSDVQDWVNSMRASPMADSYVRRTYTIFRSSMSAALAAGVLDASPCVKVSLPSKRKTSNARLYSPDELESIHKHLTYDYIFATDFMSETGLRPGEFAGLHRHRIDRQSGWLTVAEVFSGGRIKAYPKDDDQREVPLTTRALDMLDEWDERRPSSRTTCGVAHQHGRCASDTLFRQPRAQGLMRVATLRDIWAAAQEKAKIPNPGSPYDLRHAFGTRLAEAGVDPWEIMRLLGHANLEQSTTYIHRTAGARLKILAALGDPAAAKLTAVAGRKRTTRPQSNPTTVPRAAG